MDIAQTMQHIEMEITILDHQRKTIASLGRIDESFFSDQVNDSREFTILANRYVKMDDVSIYKIVFRVQYRDESSDVLFRMRNISFGDPCASVVCHKLDNMQPMPDGNAKCQRRTHPKVHYECSCPVGLEGPNCERINYCQLKHIQVCFIISFSKSVC